MVVEADHAPFGRLRYGCEHGIEYWRGSVAFPSFDRCGRAKPGRRSAKQRQWPASSRTRSRSGEKPPRPMAALHRENGLSYPAAEAADDGVWARLLAEEIDVSDDGYYGDGRIAILLIFGSTMEPSFAPAIETTDGAFQQALSGTDRHLLLPRASPIQVSHHHGPKCSTA